MKSKNRALFYTIILTLASQVAYPMNIPLLTANKEGLIFLENKRAHEVLRFSPLEHKETIPSDNFSNLVWISHAITLFGLTKKGAQEEVGYVNFSYYNQPHRIPGLAKKIGKEQYYHDCDGYIYELFVEKPYRTCGVGSQLFKKAINVMLAQQCKKIVWRAYPYGSASPLEKEQGSLNAFYEKRGGRLLSAAETNEPGEYFFVYEPHQHSA